MNVVCLRPVGGGETRFVEVQGTAEGKAFSRSELDSLLGLAERGLQRDHRPAGRDGVGRATAAPAIRRRDRVPRLRLVCASANPGKVAELRTILGDVVELLPRPGRRPRRRGGLRHPGRQRPAEGTAIATAQRAAGVADDTGLEVDALGGLPGVDTAFFAGPDASDQDNRHEAARRPAALGPGRLGGRGSARSPWSCWPDGDELWAEGTCEGEIATEERGTAASATTACSCRRTATAGRSPR